MKDLSKQFIALFIGLCASALVVFPMMWLWNLCLAPVVSGVGPLSYWQAFGLYVLINLLKGGNAFNVLKKD